MARAYPSNVPANYAAEKLNTLRARAGSNPFAPTVARVLGQVFADVPSSAVVGFTASAGSAAESTTDRWDGARYVPAVDGSGNYPSPFNEVGLFQTPAGVAGGPAPPRDASARYNTWGRLGSSSRARELLGRTPALAPGEWRTGLPETVADQVVIGLLDLDAHRAGVAAELSALGAEGRAIAPLSSAGPWAWFLAMMGFSRGPRQVARVLEPFAVQLARVAPAGRAGALAELCAGAVLNGGAPSIATRGTMDGAPYAVVRNWQKWACGAAVARAEGDTRAVAWFASSASAEVLDVLARRAGGATVEGARSAPVGGPSSGGAWGAAVFSILGAGLYLGADYLSRRA